MPKSLLVSLSTGSGARSRDVLQRMSIAAAQFRHPAIPPRLDSGDFISVLRSLIQAHIQGLCGTHTPVIAT